MVNGGAEGADAVKRGRGRGWAAALVVLLLLLAGVVVWLKCLPARATYAMKEVPMPGYSAIEFGVPQPCESAAAPEVRRYPQFKSAKPLYGKFFVHSGHRESRPEAGYLFAIDESAGTDSGYDTLYVDANHNLDLTDDKPVKSQKRQNIGHARTVFDAVTIPRARDDGGDIAVAPRLGNGAGGEPTISFPWGYIRKGSVSLGGRKYEVDLVRRNLGEDRYDTDSVLVRLYAPERGIHLGRYRAWIWRPADEMWGTLSMMLPSRGRWFSLSTTAKGDSVMVHPYAGDVGTIRVSYGGTTLGNYIANGTLHRDDGTSIYVPMTSLTGPAGAKYALQVPVGNYAPDYMGISLPSFYIAARRQYENSKSHVYSESDYILKVRRDVPCVLNIESLGTVMWSGLGEDAVFRPGDDVSARPMLATPTLAISDVYQKPVFRNLRATVKVEDSAGRKLREGPVSYLFSWRIPLNFVPRGGRETLKVTATWDTKGLFGVVTGTKEIVVESTGMGEGE